LLGRRLITGLCAAALAVLPCLLESSAEAARKGAHRHSGKKQAVREIYKTGTNHPKRFFAEYTRDRSGRPTIIYYRRYATAPGYFKTFVRQHELCHHLGYRNEIDANCCAIKRMGLSRSGIAALRNYIISRDVNSQTAVDHPGQGAAFWGKTASRCLGGAHR
jgi:hypothetical protein